MSPVEGSGAESRRGSESEALPPFGGFKLNNDMYLKDSGKPINERRNSQL